MAPNQCENVRPKDYEPFFVNYSIFNSGETRRRKRTVLRAVGKAERRNGCPQRDVKIAIGEMDAQVGRDEMVCTLIIFGLHGKISNRPRFKRGSH